MTWDWQQVVALACVSGAALAGPKAVQVVEGVRGRRLRTGRQTLSE